MDLFDLIQRGEEDVEELGVEVFPSMFGHEFDSVVEGEGWLVDSLCSQGVEGVGDRGESSFHGDRVRLSTCADIRCHPIVHGESRRSMPRL